MSTKITRPSLLTKAARAGAALYQRDRHLNRLMPGLMGNRGRRAVVSALRAAEDACEADRKGHAATYSPQRHIGLLAALIAEAGMSGTPKRPA